MMKHSLVLPALALFFAFLLAGCSSAPGDAAVVITAPPQTEAASRTAVPSASPAAAPTQPAAQPSPAPIQTPAHTQTPAPTDGVNVSLDDDFYYIPLDDALKTRITGMSYPENDSGAAIGYGDLRYVHILYVDFDGNAHGGELIVNKKVAQDIMEIFHALYEAGYPLASVRLVDDFGEPGDDNLSMAANNTSAFNYRAVTGSKTLSLHSYGLAVDVNPLFNPYMKSDGSFSPANASDYVDRTRDFPGKIDHGDLCYKLFIQYGWSWGGDWSGPKDYQHFSKK